MPKTTLSFKYDQDIFEMVDELAKKNHCSHSFVIASILRSVFKKPLLLEISFDLVDVPIRQPESKQEEIPPEK